MALLIVLWIVASAALLVSAFNVVARSGASFAASEVQLSKTEALLDSGVEIAASQLMGKKEQRGWRADGLPHTIPYSGANLIISVHDANGLVDINKADGEVLLGLFRAHGAQQATAEALRDQILTARGEDTPDPNKKPSSSQKDKRGKANAAASKNNNPWVAESPDGAPEEDKPKPHATVFLDPAQLRHLRGMTLPLYRKLAPLVTVYGRDGRINLETAPDGALAALPNLTRIDLARVRDAARSRVRNDALFDDIKQRVGEFASDEDGPAYIVKVELASGLQYRPAREFVIAVDIDDEAPFRLIAKRNLAGTGR